MSSDLANKCRTCMQADSEYCKLYDYIEDDQSVLEILDEVVPQIHIIMEDSPFSNLICHLCLDKLLTAYKFQQLCINTTNHLHSLMVVDSDSEEVNFWNPLLLMGEEDLTLNDEMENDELCDIINNKKEAPGKCDNVMDGEGEGGTDNPDNEMCDSEINKEEEAPRKCDNAMKGGGEGGIDIKNTLSSVHIQNQKSEINCSRKFRNSPSFDSPITFEKKFIEKICNEYARTEEHEDENEGEHKIRTIEKFQYSPQSFEESMQDIVDNTEWNNCENSSVDSEEECYVENNDCGLRNRSALRRVDHSTTRRDDKRLLVPLCEEGGTSSNADIHESISVRSRRKRAKKLTPQIVKWIEMFAQENPTITIKNMQRKLFEEKNINLSLSTIYCGMRELKTKRRKHFANIVKDDERLLVQLYNERQTIPEAAQLKTIEYNTTKSVIRRYRKKIQALEERKRPKKLTPDILELIGLFAECNPKITIKNMQRKLFEEKNIRLSLSTIYCGMRELRVGVGQ